MLQQFFNYLTKQNLYLDNEGEINLNLLKADLYDNKEKTIETIYNSGCAKPFFITPKGAKHAIFLRDNFIHFLSHKNKLSDSYTQYANKIGLANDEKTGEVVINFPFKDCVLKGDARTDEDKGKEIFFNEILAHAEIDRLFDPKAFTHATLISSKGEQKMFGGGGKKPSFRRKCEFAHQGQ